MAKQLLLSSISSLLGDYIEGFTKENLQSSVWTGQLEFRNLTLKKDFIRKLLNDTYYVDVKESSVSRVKVVVPWTKLATASTVLTIDTIDIVLEPSAFYIDHYSSNTDKDLAALKARIIKEAERLLAFQLTRTVFPSSSASSGSDFSSGGGYDDKSLEIFANFFSKINALTNSPLLLKIVSNISVVISNVNIRYVDSATRPARTAIFGLGIAEVSIKMSPDSQAASKQPAPEGSDAAEAASGADTDSSDIPNRRYSVSSNSSINNGTLEGQIIVSRLHVYCSTVATAGGEWREAAKECILHPVNMRAALHRPADRDGNFRMDLSVSSSPVKVVLRKEHMELFCGSVDHHQRMNRYRHLRLFRPAVSAKVAPRLWWQYALLLLTGNENYVFYYKHTLDQMNSCREAYRDLLSEYYDLQYAYACVSGEDKGIMRNFIKVTDDLAYKLSSSSSSSKQSTRRQFEERRQGAARDLEALEAQLPVQVVLMCRQAALTSLFEARVKTGEAARLFMKICDDSTSTLTKTANTNSSTSSTASKGGDVGSAVADAALDGFVVDDLPLTLHAAVDTSISTKSSLSISLQRTQASLLLVTGEQEVVEYSLALVASVNVSESCDVDVSGALSDVLVHDCMERDGVGDRPVVVYFDAEAGSSGKGDSLDAITFAYTYCCGAASPQRPCVSRCVIAAKRLVFQSCSSRLLYHYSDFVLSPVFSWFILLTNGVASDYPSTRSIARRSGSQWASPPPSSISKMIRGMEVEIDARGPLVILPHEDALENGFLVVDFERLYFYGVVVDFTQGFNCISIMTPNVGFYLPLTIGDVSTSAYKAYRVFDKPVTVALRCYAAGSCDEVVAESMTRAHEHLSRSIRKSFPGDSESMLSECVFAAGRGAAPADSPLICEGFSAVEMRAFSTDLALRPSTIHRMAKMVVFLCSVGSHVYSIYLKAAHVSEGVYRATNNNLYTRYSCDIVNAKVFRMGDEGDVSVILRRLARVKARCLTALRCSHSEEGREEEEEEEEAEEDSAAAMDMDDLLLSYANMFFGQGEQQSQDGLVYACVPGASRRIDVGRPIMTFTYRGHMHMRLMLDDDSVWSPEGSPSSSSRSAPGDHFCLVIEMGDVVVSTRERSLDMETRVRIGSLRVFEELRFSMYSVRAAEVQQNFLLRSDNDGSPSSEPFCELLHSSVSSAASPLYAFYGGALSVVLQNVSALLNNTAIYSLKGVIGALASVDGSVLSKRPCGSEGERLFTIDHSTRYYLSSLVAAHADPVNRACALHHNDGVCFAYTGSLRPKHFWHSYLTKDIARRKATLEVRSVDIEVTNTIVDDPTYLPGQFIGTPTAAFNADEEQVFRVVFRGVEASYSTNESLSGIAMLADVKVSVRDFEMVDTREMCRDWHFRTLMRFVPPSDTFMHRLPHSRRKGNHQSVDRGVEARQRPADPKGHWWMDLPPTGGAQGDSSAQQQPASGSDGAAAESKAFFELVLSQERVGSNRLDVTINNLLSCGSLDALKDVGNTSLAVLYAFMCVLTPTPNPNLTRSPPVVHDYVFSPKSNYTLSLRMPNPYMLVLDDPSIASSRAFVVACEVDVQFSLDQWKGRLLESQEALHLTAQAVEVYSIADVSMWMRAPPSEREGIMAQQRIVAPASIDFHMTRNLERLVVLSANVSMNMSDFFIDISLENAELLQSVLFRMTLSCLKPARIVDTARYCLLGAQGSDRGTQVDIYSLALNMGRFCINAVDDSDRRPIIQATLNSSIFSVQGALHPKIMVDNVSVYLQLDVHHVEGAGQMAFQVDFYNPALHMGEPIIEPFAVDVAVRKDYRGLEVEVECPAAIQLNLSGQMLETTLKLYEAYRRKADEGARRGAVGVAAVPRRGRGHSQSRRVQPETAALWLTVHNRLLCEVSFKFETTAGTEMGTLLPGSSQIVAAGERFQSKLLLAQLGLDLYGWSAVKTLGDKSGEYRFDFPHIDSNSTALTLTLRVTKSTDTSYEFTLFTSGAFLDKTGLGLCIKGYRKGEGVARSSTSTNVPADLLVAMQGEQWVQEYSTMTALAAGSLVVQSKRSYRFNMDSPGKGECVYSDRHSIVWIRLPKFMLGQCWLLTANDDFAARTSDLVRFTVNKPCVVLLLFSASNIADAKRVPSWLHSAGFTRTLETAVARDIFTDQDSHYLIFGKPLSEGGSELCLGGVEPAGYSGCMYAVCLVDPHRLQCPPAPHPPRFRSLQLLYPTIGRMLSDARLFQSPALGDSWLHGKGGSVMFYSDDRRAKVGFAPGQGGPVAWSDALPLDLRSTSLQSGALEVARAPGKCYQLFYTVKPLPGLFGETALVTLMPRFCILNCMDETLSFRQYGSEEGVLAIEPYQYSPWHKSSSKLGSKIQLRSKSSQWSYGGFDINEVGASAFLLPSTQWFDGSSNHDAVIVHVEVKLAEASECCAAVAVVWKALRQHQATISIKNDSSVPITLNQANLVDEKARPGAQTAQAQVLSRYCLCVPPGGLYSFGWADPSTTEQPCVTVTVGTPPFGRHHSSKTIGLLRLYDVLRMPIDPADARDEEDTERDNSDPYPNGEIFVSIQPLGSGKVIRVVHSVAELGAVIKTGSSAQSSLGPSGVTTGAIVTGAVISSLVLGPFAAILLAGGAVYAVHTSHDMQQRRVERAITDTIESKAKQLSSNAGASDEGDDGDSRAALNIYSISLSVRLRSLSISITVEKPVRREFLSIHLDSCEFKLSANSHSKSVELQIQDLQVDTFADTAVAPVVVHTARDASSADSPVMQVVVVEETCSNGSATPHFKYIAARMLELRIIVDSASLKLFFVDLGCDFSLMSPQAMLAIEAPEQWAEEFTRGVALAENSSQFVDVFRSQSKAQAPRVYIENLILHPVKMTVTFLQTALPAKIDDQSHAFIRSMLSYIPSFASLDGATIKLNSFIVHDAMESSEALLSRVVANATNDLQNQLGRLAGSLNAIGRPVGLAKNVGGGVQAFFYEPYRGAMRSPSSFVAGIGKGAGRLFGGLVGGALNSTAAIVSSASHSLSQSMVYVSGDEDFAMKRARKTHKAVTAARAGVVSGLLEGGGSFVSGFATGVSGIVTDPISGAISTGLGGFIKGVGSGLVGVAVKPVLGISDGLNSVAQTIYYQNSDLKNLHVIRPQRTYDCIYINNATSARMQLLTPIDYFAIEAQVFVRRFSSLAPTRLGLEQDFYCGYLSLARDGESAMKNSIILSNSYVCWRQFISKYKPLEGSLDGPSSPGEDEEAVEEHVLLIPWTDVSHCSFSPGEESVDVLTGTDIFTVSCGAAARAELLFHLLLKNSYRMKNPHYMLGMGPASASAAPPPSEKTTGAADGHMLLAGLPLEYKFGSENIRYLKPLVCDDSNPPIRTLKVGRGTRHGVRGGPSNKIIEWFETAVLGIVGSFSTLPSPPPYDDAYELYRRIDAAMFHLVYDWYLSHQGYDRSICGVFCVINGLLWPVQLVTLEMRAGNGCVLVPGHNYSVESRVMGPGGMVFVFAWGVRPSYLRRGNCEIFVATSAFRATLTTRFDSKSTGATELPGLGGAHVRLLESSHGARNLYCKKVLYIAPGSN